MKFDFSIQYKQGAENVVADALSRVEFVECHNLVTSKIQNLWSSNHTLQKLISEIVKDPSSHKYYTWLNGEIRRKGRLAIGNYLNLRKYILHWLHAFAIGRHSSRHATLQRLKIVVYWKGMHKDVQLFVQQCITCQQYKYDNTTSPGLL